MSITDELREYDKKQISWLDASKVHYRKLLAIADRIDAALAERYVELPKDADGEPIHIGDVMEDGLEQAFTPKKVKMLMLEDDEWMLNFGGGWSVMKHHEWRHHTPDTWERIIEDAREYRLNIGGSYLWKNKSDELVARCKALAGGEQ